MAKFTNGSIYDTLNTMFQTMKQLLILAIHSKKIWIIPIILFLIIIALLIISAQISPLPVFLYPIL